MTKIFCFGNPDIKEDSIALEFADELRIEGFEFIKCTSPDFLLNLDEKEIIIIDVMKGIKDVRIIEDINKIKPTKTTTMHDFDLGTVLKLMKEVGQVKKIKIIGIPEKGDKEKVRKEILKILDVK